MSLVPRNDRPAKYEAKKVANKMDGLGSQIAILERDNAGFETEREVREKTTRRNAIPNPNAECTTMFVIGKIDFTVEMLEEFLRP